MMATTAQPAQTGGIFVGQSPRVDASEQLILGLLLKVAKKGRSVELRAVRPNFTEVGDDGLLKLSEFKDLQIRRGKDWLLLRGLRNWQELVLDPSSFEEICYYVVACQRELEEARRIRMVQRVRERTEKKPSIIITFNKEPHRSHPEDPWQVVVKVTVNIGSKATNIGCYLSFYDKAWYPNFSGYERTIDAFDALGKVRDQIVHEVVRQVTERWPKGA